MIDGNPNNRFSILFVSDPNLGPRGIDVISRFFSRVTPIIWNIHDQGNSLGKEQVRKLIRSQAWDICLSFYNDFIFDRTDLAHFSVALNIHPSLPEIRGMGYDTLPIIENHEYFGVTLHYIDSRIDSGEIIRISKEKLPRSMTHTQLREISQRLCMIMLETVVKDICSVQNLAGLKKLYASLNKSLDVRWSRGYTSRDELARRLAALRKENPKHGVFR